MFPDRSYESEMAAAEQVLLEKMALRRDSSENIQSRCIDLSSLVKPVYTQNVENDIQ